MSKRISRIKNAANIRRNIRHKLGCLHTTYIVTRVSRTQIVRFKKKRKHNKKAKKVVVTPHNYLDHIHECNRANGISNLPSNAPADETSFEGDKY